MKSHVLVNRWGPRLWGETAKATGKAVRTGTVLSQSSRGHSWAAAVSHCRAVWGDTQHSGILRYHRVGTAQWPEPGSSLSPLPCKCFHVRTAQPVTTSLLTLQLYEHQHIIPDFILCLPRVHQEAQCPFSTDEPLLTVNFTPCMSLLTQHTQLPCFPFLSSGMFFKLIQDLICCVYSAYWMNAKLQEVFTSGKPC